MPIQAPQWTDYLNCPACCREFAPPRSPVSLGCGHTLCRLCLKNLHRKQCPFDQTVISVGLDELVVNTALLQLAGYPPPAQPYHPPCIRALSEQDRRAYDVIVKCLEQLAVFLKYSGNASVNIRLSRPMQRKLVTLLQCAMTDEEGRGKAARAARSLGERTVTELILQHQNPQQLSANLWAAVRARGCQFLGPAMQEEVLKLVLLALEDGSALSRKVLVMFVVQRLEPHFPQASKTSIGHVVQLLYRASCFKVSKRESDSSLMQLKEEFRTYETLRREHDAQIVQIATEAGLRIAPDQWSALLYGDTQHKSHMQSIIDKLQTPQSFAQSVQELFIALQRTGDPVQLIVMSTPLDRLANIDASPDAKSPTWQQLSETMTSLKEVVSGLVNYMQHQVNGRDANHNSKILERLPETPTAQQSTLQGAMPGRYKVAMCRDAQTRTYCPRGNNCTYAHTEEELERYRRINSTANNGNYQYLMPVIQPPIAVPRPVYQRFSVPPPALPGMENNYISPLQQMSPSPRRSMIGADAPERDQSYEHEREQPFELRDQPFELRDQPFEHREQPYEHRDQPYEHREQLYEHSDPLYEHSDQPYEHRDQPYEHREQSYDHGLNQLYEHAREQPYEQAREPTYEIAREPSYELAPLNVSNDNFVGSYASALLHGVSDPLVNQNGNISTMLPHPGHFYTPYVSERAAYPYLPIIDTGRIINEEMVQYPGMAGPIGAVDQSLVDYPVVDYSQQAYSDDNVPEMVYESLSFGISATRSVAQPPEQAWPANNAIKRVPMFKFNDMAKNLPIGMEMAKNIPMGMEMANNLPIGMEMAKNLPIGMDMSNNLPIGMEMTNNMPIGMPQTNGDMMHHGMEIVRIKPKAAVRTETEKRDDQELEKELQALEQRISTEFSKASDQVDTDVEE